MEFSAEQVRVLAALVEKEAAVPDTYPLTLNALRQACNQSNNRNPVVTYDDHTIDRALSSLKSIGLVRFVHPSHGGRTTRYRQVAAEQWNLEPGELVVLAMLALRGPSTSAELRSRVDRFLPSGSPTVDEALEALMAREPEPFATRLERRSGEREPRYAHLLGGHEAPAPSEPAEAAVAEPRESAEPAIAPEPASMGGPGDSGGDRLAALEEEVGRLRRRLDRLERALGVADDDA